MNIAIYGKGGIGKSTIATNISVMLANQGAKVLQVGCDPKHDSTLSLLEGKEQMTVIDSIGLEVSDEDIIVEGRHGISCVEIGGPQPGLGCAGRGMISGLSMLEQLKKYREADYTHIIYDILGDVVCGGFFEPLKKRKVEKMYIVTSGEFNSLFAANNLCKGYENCRLADKGIVLAGMIGNCRGISEEEKIIGLFCEKTGVPLVSVIPRDNRIEKCTILGQNIVDDCEDSLLCDSIGNIVKNIQGASQPYHVNFLELNELRELYRGMVI